MDQKSESYSTSSEKPEKIKAKNKQKILSKIEKTKINFDNGYWLQAKNVTKKGYEIFINQLNRWTSYRKYEKNHTFTHVFYIPNAGYTLINFLNENIANQFFMERQGANWLDETFSDDENEEDENNKESEENEKMEEYKDIYKTKDIFEYEKFDENEVSERKEEYEEDVKTQKNQESENKIEKKLVDDFIECKIEKIDVNQKKLFEIIEENLRRVENGKKYYYFFLFKDTENAEKYFKYVIFPSLSK